MDLVNQYVSKLSEMITTEDSLTDKNKLLYIRHLDIGEFFSGVVYVKDTFHRRNRNSEKYDLTFRCLDGDGVSFNVKMFDTDLVEIKNEIVLIKKGQSIKSMYNDDIYYNVSSIIRYRNVTIPISEFIKAIPRVAYYKQEFEKLINELRGTKYGSVFTEMQEKGIDIQTELSSNPYSRFLGTKLGSPMKMCIDFSNILKSIYPEDKDNQNRYYLTITTAILVIYQNVINEKDQSQRSGVLKVSGINMELFNLIMNTNLLKEFSDVIMSALVNYSVYRKDNSYKGATTLETILFSTLNLVENNIYLSEMAEHEVSVLPDGRHII